MRRFKYFLFLLLGIVVVMISIAAHYYYIGFYKPKTVSAPFTHRPNKFEVIKLKGKAMALKSFVENKPFNKKIVFLVDMGMPSGKNRFFVYDISKDSILKSALVAHGSANKEFCLKPVFSNEKQSGCTALGKYKIGNPYFGRFGKAYKLYGLDSSNSNAFFRNIVLHSYACVPEMETDPYPICNSLGCPMVAPAFLKELQTIIDDSPQPILLWIFE